MVSVGKECRQPLLSAQYEKKKIHKLRSGVHGDLSRVDNGFTFKCRRCDGTSQEAYLVGGWRDIWMCRAFAILETLLIEMVEQILLLQLESEMDG